VVDITEISAIVAAAGVLAGVVYYVLQMRNQTRMRKTDLIVRINPWFNISPKELLEYANTVLALEYKDYDDFVQKYGSLYGGKPEANALRTLLNWADGLGMLLKRDLVDLDIVVDSYGGIAEVFWEKVKPLVEGYRKDTHYQHHYESFEYLVNVIEKRQQQLASKKA
jgi:hypothetical protein